MLLCSLEASPVFSVVFPCSSSPSHQELEVRPPLAPTVLTNEPQGKPDFSLDYFLFSSMFSFALQFIIIMA